MCTGFEVEFAAELEVKFAAELEAGFAAEVVVGFAAEFEVGFLVELEVGLAAGPAASSTQAFVNQKNVQPAITKMLRCPLLNFR